MFDQKLPTKQRAKAVGPDFMRGSPGPDDLGVDDNAVKASRFLSMLKRETRYILYVNNSYLPERPSLQGKCRSS